MAEIELQRKKPPIWPWILGAAALVALIWIGAEMFTDDVEDDTLVTVPAAVDAEPTPTPGTPGQPGAGDVQAFREACGSASTIREEMGESHTHEAECLSRLATALEAEVQRDTVQDQALQERLDVLRRSADSLTANPQSTQHAEQLNRALEEAALVIERMAETRDDVGDELRRHVSEMTAAADELERTELLLEQKQAAGNFFEHAAMALQAMAGGASPRS